MALTIGTILGSYEIQSAIGAGGMGEVYRARDSRLARDVAVKVLPANFSADADRLRRFEQEARAAASLNHPNILAIYDIGTQDGSPYIVSELLEGETLRERLRGGALAMRKAVEIALQIARGLAAAGEKGIVHRDLKPENIFVTRDGRVKILDFGLAKLNAPQGEVLNHSNIPTVDSATTPGMVLGTVGYMSPEQVRGQTADHRSDIFSLGAILYEMLSGARAFKGETTADTMSSILKGEPPELAETNRNVSPALERIVRHCLEKNAEERFQSARDIAFDLEAMSGTSASVALPARPASRRLWPVVAAIVVLLAAAAGVFIGMRLVHVPDPRFKQITFRRGYIGNARFAPDGDTVVYFAMWEGKPGDLYSGRTDSPGERAMGIPDGVVLAISGSGELALRQNWRLMGGFARAGTLTKMPLAGGAPRAVLDDVQDADWSKDGKDLAIIRYIPATTAWRLEYPIGTVLYETHGWISDARISPSGDKIAFADHPTPDGDDRGTIAVVDIASKKKRTLTGIWSSAQGVAWSPSGDEVWFTASDSGSSRSLFAVSLHGKLRPLARVPASLTLQDVNRNGRILLRKDTARFEIQALGPGQQHERELDWLDWSRPTDFSADGKYVLFEEEGEGGGTEYTIYMRSTDGSPAVALGHGSALSFSPDGRWVLTRALNSNPAQFVLLPTGAGESHQITHDQINHIRGQWFPDGKQILCDCNEPGHGQREFVVDVDSGQARPVTPEGVTGGLLSPDGKSILARDLDGKLTDWPAEGGERKVIAGFGPKDIPLQWTADGKSIYFTTRDPADAFPRRKVYLFNLATGQKHPVASLGPPDLSGVGGIDFPRFAANGKAYMYAYLRDLSELYVVDGLK